MSAGPTRVLVLGLDAASPELLEAWTADGTLPHLRSLTLRGTSGRLGGIEGFFVGSTWPTLYTGTGPGRHGFHYQLQIAPGSYDLQWSPASDFVRTEPFWSALERSGRRVAALDVPLSRPAPGMSGVQVVEWGGHDAFFGFHTTPPELGRELVRRHGLHPQGTVCDARRTTVRDHREFLERLEAGIRAKVTWTGELLARGGWDLFAQVFTEGHCAGHQCWHLHDPTHPAHDPELAAALGDPLRRIYVALDAAVGELVASAGDAHVLVFTGHGMASWYGAQFLLRGILNRLGVTAAPRTRTGPRVRRIAERVWTRLPERLRAPIRAARAHLPAGPSAPARPDLRLHTDLERSLCFPLDNGQAVGGIRLNLAGREPGGRLAPGAEAEAFCAQLAADLCEIVDERTGEPLVRAVRRTDALHAGEAQGHLPDLLVEWNDLVATGTTQLADGAGATVRARSPKIGVVEGANDYGRTGEHRPGGWIVAVGPGVPHDRLKRVVPLTDLAPTLAALVDAEMPQADGRPAPELLGERRAGADPTRN